MAKFSFLLTILLIVHNLHETFNLEICNENCQSEPFLNLEEKILENINHTKTPSADDDKSNSDNHEHDNYQTSVATFMNENENVPTVVNDDGNSTSNLSVTNSMKLRKSKSVNWSYLMLNNKSYNTKNLDSLNFINNDGRNFVEYDKNHHQPQQNQQANNVILNHNNDNEILQIKDEGYVKALGQKFLRLQPPFDPAYSTAVSAKCRQHAKHYLQALENYELWALKMHDSSGKLSSSILNGNINQFGDFDQCLNVESSNNAYRGKYCLTYLQADVPKNTKYLKHLHTLVQSHSVFKSKFEDPGHRVPRFSTIHWALCVPSTCTNKDVEASLREFMTNSTLGMGLNFRIQVDKEMCQVKNVNWVSEIDRGTLIAISVFLFILMISLLSTLYEYKSETKNEWLIAFSLIKNTKALVSLERDPNDIVSIHAIRCFNAIMLVIAHKSMALFFQPYTNRTEMSEILGKPFTVLGRAASLYTDPFIMLSGLLTAYSLFGKLQRGQKIKFVQEFVGRLLRIVPPLGALILFCTYVLPLLGSGPQWNLVITHHSDICKTYWWRNLMFIHNYFGFENMCLTHTHHVGIDTQLFITTPIIIMIIWKWPKKGTGFIIGLAMLSTVARYYVTITRKLSNYVYFGTTVSQLFDTANFMYIIPAHRFTVYVMGILLGYVLRLYKNQKLTTTQIRIGWSINTTLLLIAFFGPAPMGSIDYVYNPTHAAYYAAFSPIAWCSFFAWMIFTTHLGYDNIFTPLMSWRGFLITTRLSYAVYLTQFPVFFFNVGLIRSSEHYDFFSSVLKTNEMIWVLLTSVVLILFFESPFGNLKRLLFRSKPKQTTSKTKGSVVDSTTPSRDDTLSTKFINYSKNLLDDLPNKDIIYSGDDDKTKKTN